MTNRGLGGTSKHLFVVLDSWHGAKPRHREVHLLCGYTLQLPPASVIVGANNATIGLYLYIHVIKIYGGPTYTMHKYYNFL